MFIFSSKTILEFHFSHPNHWYCWRGCAARLEKSKQPLSHSARVAGAATQPLTHSERLGSHSATHSVRVAGAAYWSTQKKKTQNISPPPSPTHFIMFNIGNTLLSPAMVPHGPNRPRIHAAVLIHQLLLLALAFAAEAKVLLQGAEIHGKQDLVVLVVTGTLAGQQSVTADLLAMAAEKKWDVWRYIVNYSNPKEKIENIESRWI